MNVGKLLTMTLCQLINRGGPYIIYPSLRVWHTPLPLYMSRIPPPLLSYCQGKKGGQSPLSSIIYKKENTSLYVKKNSGKIL